MNGTPKFEGGQTIAATYTDGGHQATSSQRPAFPDFHRKFADPSAFGFMALGACFTVYAVNLLEAQGVAIKESTVPAAAVLGSVALLIATIFEFLSGATFAATMFGVYTGFFAGFCVLHIGWFGLTGSYDGVKPNLYSGQLSNELNDVQGLWISTFVIINFCLLLPATRLSVALLVFLTFTELFFVLHMVNSFVSPPTSVSALTRSTAAFSFLSGLAAFYLAAASLLTKESSFFTLPTGILSRRSRPV